LYWPQAYQMQLMYNRKKLSIFLNWFVVKPKVICAILFLFGITGTIYISYKRQQILTESAENKMNLILKDIHDNMERTLQKSFEASFLLESLLHDTSRQQNFNSISKQLLKANPFIYSIEITSAGNVKYIYPIRENEATKNLNLLSSIPLKEKQIHFSNKKKLSLEGPLQLNKGGMGIIVKRPVFIRNKFKGCTNIVIKLNSLLKTAGINAVDSSKYDLQFTSKDSATGKELFFLSHKLNRTKDLYVSSLIADSRWKLYLIDKKTYGIYPLTYLTIIIGGLLSLLIAYLVMKLLQMPQELQLLVDHQHKKIIDDELKFKAIIDHSTIGFVLLDVNSGTFADVNEKLCKILGYTREEIRTINFIDLTHPDDLKDFHLSFDNLKNGTIRDKTLEKRCLTKSGTIIWVNLTFSALWEINEKPTNLSVFIKDITDQKNTERKIVESQKNIKSLVDTIDGIVWEYNLEHKNVCFVSSKVEFILGYTPEEWMKIPFFWENHLYPEDKEWLKEYCAASDINQTNRDYEYRIISKSGQIVWIRDIVELIVDNGITTSLRGIMIDITKTKEAEKDLKNTLFLVTEQNKRLLNFSYIVSHNLRSHTSNIASIVSLIESTESEEEKEEMMNLLKTVSHSLDETMNHLNEVVNINENINITTKPLNLNQYITNTQIILSEQIHMSEAKIISTIDKDKIINYNPAYLESILYNLISNAMRYKHPERKPLIRIKLYKEQNKEVLEISDNGIGIDLDKNGAKIFGMYKTFSSNLDSKGIGLFITKNQINAMGGTITVSSKINVGTTFKISI
jgi:PAS domain S-box-containing protein